MIAESSSLNSSPSSTAVSVQSSPAQPDVRTSLTVNGRTIAYLSCSPEDLKEQAVEFLFRQDLITTQDQIADIRVCKSEHNIDIWLTCPLPKTNDLLSPQNSEDWND